MRFFKRFLRISIAVLILGGIGLGVMYHLSTRTPSGYRPLLLTEAQRNEAAQRLQLKLPALHNMAAQSQAGAGAAQKAQARGAPIPPDAAKKVEPVTVTFTQDEINGFLWRWSTQYKAKYEQYVTDPYIVLEEGSIVLMATVPEFGRVASAYFEPKLDENGQLRCDLAGIKLGSLPLPQSILSKKRSEVEHSLKAQLPVWQNKAKIDSTGAANSDARSAALGKMVLNMFNEQPSPPALFIDTTAKTVTVQITKVLVEKGALTITVQPMDAAQLAALLEQIKAPVQTALVETPKG